MGYPGRLIYGVCVEGCRTRRLRRVALGVGIYLCTSMTIGLTDSMYYCNGEGCGD